MRMRQRFNLITTLCNFYPFLDNELTVQMLSVHTAAAMLGRVKWKHAKKIGAHLAFNNHVATVYTDELRSTNRILSAAIVVMMIKKFFLNRWAGSRHLN